MRMHLWRWKNYLCYRLKITSKSVNLLTWWLRNLKQNFCLKIRKKMHTDRMQIFSVRNGWFTWFKNQAGFHNVKWFVEVCKWWYRSGENISVQFWSNCRRRPIFTWTSVNVDEIGLYYHKIPLCSCTSFEEKTFNLTF